MLDGDLVGEVKEDDDSRLEVGDWNPGEVGYNRNLSIKSIPSSVNFSLNLAQFLFFKWSALFISSKSPPNKDGYASNALLVDLLCFGSASKQMSCSSADFGSCGVCGGIRTSKL